MSKPKNFNPFSHACYRIIRFFVWLFYPKITVEGTENLPKEPCIIVGNHAQMNGPISAQLYMPKKNVIWCAHQMMHLKEVPNYAFTDFWSNKPKSCRWFYRILSYIIAPFSVCIFNNASTIPVYRDSRLLSTFRTTLAALEDNTNTVIFPECATTHNPIVNEFQDKFVDIGKMYYKRTGKALPFVPIYIAPKLKTMHLGTPIYFQPDQQIEQERRRICNYLMDQITQIACELPYHKVVPYANISKKDYPTNHLSEDYAYEKTDD